MQRFELNPEEICQIDHLIAKSLRACGDVESETFHAAAPLFAHELPRRLRSCILCFHSQQAAFGTLVISGFPVDDSAIGQTPSSLSQLPSPSRTCREEAFLVLMTALLGDTIGWATQQSGRLIHDVFPIRQHQHMQLGTGCRQLLTWHTEDAFHPMRSDYVGMLCLRNPQQAATMIGSIGSLDLNQACRESLFQKAYTILPDESHRGVTDLTDPPGEMPRPQIAQMLQQPPKIAVLFGDLANPYVRMDPYFMPLPDEPAHREAFQTIVAEFDKQLVDVVLQPGDLCIMDNYRVVHGRRPFQAKFDGRDRWLKRVLIARDLRKSAGFREQQRSRVLR